MRYKLNGIKYAPYTLLIAIYLFIYRKWLFSTSILTSGDWQYYYRNTLSSVRIDYFSIWLSDSSFGRILIDSGQAPTYALYGFLARYFGANYNIAERVISMVPVIILTPLGAYLLAQHIFRHKPASIIAAIMYSFNTYILTLQTGDLTLAGPYAVAPFIMYSFIKLLTHPSLRNIIVSGILLAISTAYEPRGTYVTLIAIGMYIVCKAGSIYFETRNLKRFFSALVIGALPILLLGMLNIYWILALSHADSSSSTVIGEGLFGSQYFKLTNALTIFQPYWSGGKPVAFIIHSIPFYSWFIPISAFSSLYLYKKNRYVLFFGLVSITGILLAKQADSPITGLYAWLYLHLPGFNAFREASKFYALTSLGYAMLIAALISGLSKNKIQHYHKHLSWAVFTILAIILLYNAVPIATGRIGTLFVDRHIPAAEVAANNYINSQPDYFRTLWLPTTTRWIDYTNEHPAESMSGLINGPWAKLTGYKSNSIIAPTNQQLIKIFSTSYINQLLNAGSIKYIIVPSRDIANDNDFYVHFGDDRKFFIDALNKVHGLKHINIKAKGVDIYENTSYSKYAYGASAISQLPSLDQLDQDYSFISKTLPKSKDFTTDKVISDANKITPIFDNLTANDIKEGSVSSTRTKTKDSTIYNNLNAQKISYKFDASKIKIYTQKNNSLNNLSHTATTQVIGESSINSSGGDYGIAHDNQVTALKNSSSLRTFDKTPANIKVLETTSANLIVNSSLESGLWQKEVSDCNAYDSNAAIGQSLSDDSTDGSYSLELAATNHTACTSPKSIKVTGGENLWLKFDFKVLKGKEAGYQVVFNDKKHTQQKVYLPVTDGNWTNLSRLIHIPSGATSMKLVIEAFPNDASPYRGIVLYDNFNLKTVDTTYNIDINNSAHFIASSNIYSGNVSYKDTSVSGINSIPNAQFKNGLWQKKVNDCNAHDNKPLIGMSLGKNNIDGSRYLQLSAQRHIACTGPNPINVSEGQSYSLSFKYESPNAQYGGYSLKFNDPNRTVINNDQLQVNGKNWKQFSTSFKVPYGATSVQLTLYSYSDESVGKIRYINRYSNFSLKAIPDLAGNYYAVQKTQSNNSIPRSITSEQTSPTKKEIKVKGAKSSFYLVMAESFNTGWKLEISGSTLNSTKDQNLKDQAQAIIESQHYEINGFENGWYINVNQLCKVQKLCTVNADGTYSMDLTAVFAPQRYMEVGLLISGSTLLICLGYLLFGSIKIHKFLTNQAYRVHE